MSARVDHTVTSGTFTLDGETFDVDNNVWVIGDDNACVVIDAPHDAQAIADLVGDRKVVAIVCTHGHDDHVRVAPELSRLLGAPVWLNAADLPVWHLTHEHDPDGVLVDGDAIEVAGIDLEVIATPGHSPGSVCLYAPALGALFSGDTLFHGGPGATGRSYSDHGAIVESIRKRLFALPDDTIVHAGHGDDTTIGAEKARGLAS